TLDARGNVVEAVNPLTINAKATYDSTGVPCSPGGSDATDLDCSEKLIIGLEDPAGGETDDIVTSATYDSNGNATTQTDPMGQTTRATYNELGEVESVTDPLGNTNKNMYDD